MFSKIGLLKKFAKRTGKHLYRSLFLNKVAGLCNFIKKETLVQVISYEICEIFKNTFFHRTPPVAASEMGQPMKILVRNVELLVRNVSSN